MKIICTRLIRLKVSIGLHYASEKGWKPAIVRVLLMCMVSTKTSERFVGLRPFRWHSGASQKLREHWGQEILKASVVHFRSHMFSPSITAFAFPLYLLTFDLYHGVAKWYCWNCYIRKKKNVYRVRQIRLINYIKSRALPRNKSASWLVVRHRKPRKG
jgi:hypothetical protein